VARFPSRATLPSKFNLRCPGASHREGSYHRAGYKSVGYGYTNADLTSIVTPSGQTISYSYTNHRITSITVNSTAVLSGVTYDPFGPANGWTWGDGIAETRTYNTDGNPSTVVMKSETVTARYDNALRISSIGRQLRSRLYLDAGLTTHRIGPRPRPRSEAPEPPMVGPMMATAIG